MAWPFPIVEDGYFDLSPDLAGRLLKTQVPNRPVKANSIQYLRRQLETGKYRDSARFLGINEEDQLVDGQHLCYAVIESGVTVKTRAARIRASDVLAVDVGWKRSAGDLVSLRGIANAGTIVGALRTVRSIESCEGKGRLSLTPGRLLSNEEIWEQIQAEPMLQDSAQGAAEISKFVPFIPTSEIAGLHHLFRLRAGDEKAQGFWDELSDPDEDTLLYKLRRHLLAAQSAQRKPSRLDMLARIAAAWNLWLADKMTGGVPLPRKFPVIAAVATKELATA